MPGPPSASGDTSVKHTHTHTHTHKQKNTNRQKNWQDPSCSKGVYRSKIKLKGKEQMNKWVQIIISVFKKHTSRETDIELLYAGRGGLFERWDDSFSGKRSGRERLFQAE